MPLVTEVILPVSLKNTFFYTVPEEHQPFLQEGKRVLVPFGKKSKLYTGMVYKIYHSYENLHSLKPIHKLLDELPVVQPIQLAFWNWIAEYYCCSLGEVMLMALPNHLFLHSASFVHLTETFQSLDWSTLSPKEQAVLNFLASQPMPYPYEKLKKEFSSYILNKLIQKEVLSLTTQVQNPYKPQLKTFIALNWQTLEEKFNPAQALSRSEVLASALKHSKSENHHKILLYLLQNPFTEKQFLMEFLNIKESALKTLEKKKWIVSEKHAIDRVQLKTFSEIQYHLDDKELLFCKKFYQDLLLQTEWTPIVFFHDLGNRRIAFYIEWFKNLLNEGKQVLFLVPEIAFSDKFVVELQNHFPDELGIYHSRINEQERVEIWYKVFLKEYKIIIGVRSALFLPFSALGLVLVDEEQDVYYKQEEKNPRLNVRDASIYYAKMLNIPIILSTQAPSIETYYYAQQKKYRLVSYQRAPNLLQNQIQTVDIKSQITSRESIGLLSVEAHKALYEAKQKKKISVIFLNRKGYSPRRVCNACGYVHFCAHCDIALTYHKQINKLKCHYCGYQEDNLYFCKNCGSHDLAYEGFGTEKVEEQLETILKNFRIKRLDSDTIRTKKEWSDFLASLQQHEVDIVLGTQKITKVLHHKNIERIIVLLADLMLHIPNFRALEYTYQFLKQLIYDFDMPYHADKKLLIQTRMPSHKVFQFLTSDYATYYHEQILHREELHYPPFVRLIELELLHPHQDTLYYGSPHFDKLLKSQFSEWILGPSIPGVAKLKNLYRVNYLVKIPKTQSPVKLKEHIMRAFSEFQQIEKDNQYRLLINVDPK